VSVNGGASTDDAATPWPSAMADVSKLSLSDLAELSEEDDSVLARSLRRLADDLANPGEPIAGFNSAL
jgi:FXSXX-COOH protein